MYTFPVLLKKIRESADITQEEFASVLGVSTILVSMIETGQKDVSKNFILRLAERLGVRPNSVTPFLFIDENHDKRNFSKLDLSLIAIGEKLQDNLVKNKAKNLRKYVQH
ncbi:MAG: helix-turn-helix transcriptional regulator [bacterium]|nr:helix-turn-helix transcriptional regulator [bacterium]